MGENECLHGQMHRYMGTGMGDQFSDRYSIHNLACLYNNHICNNEVLGKGPAEHLFWFYHIVINQGEGARTLG